MAKNLNLGASGKVKIQVINEKGEVVLERPWQKNMLLDSGMTGINSRSWAKSFEYAVAGTGSTGSANYPVRIFTGQTVNISGTAAATVAGTFTGKTGYLLVAMPVSSTDSALQAKITAVNGDGSGATLDVSLPAVTGYGLELWRVNQTALVTETVRSNTYVTSGCGWSIPVSGQLRLFRTYDFPTEGGGGTTYTELGFSWGTTGTNLFSRVPITSLAVPGGSKLRVTYEIDLFINGYSGVKNFAPITGWGSTLAAWGWQSLGLEVVSPSSGATIPSAGSTSCNEPSGSASMFLSSVNAPLATLFSDVNRASGSSFVSAALSISSTSALGGYFYATKTGLFDAATANGANWYSLGVTSPDAPGVRNGFALVFDSTQTKLSTQSLELDFLYSWARSLTGESN